MATLSILVLREGQVFNGDNVKACQGVGPNVFGDTVSSSIRMGQYVYGDTVDESLEGEARFFMATLSMQLFDGRSSF